MEKQRKTSKKRNAILETIRSTKIHPNAEWVYAQLKPVYPDLSLGTVYRNIALFRETGEIVSVGMVAGQERFDGDTAPHSHFICSHCGSVIDIRLPEAMESSIRSFESGLPLKAESHSLTFYGCCENCIPKESLPQ